MADGNPGTPIAELGMTRFDWERLVRRSGLSPADKYMALMLATYAAAQDGTRVHPGRDRLIHVTGHTKDWVGKRMESLRHTGWLARPRRGNRHQGQVDSHVLAVPAALEPALDPDEQPW